MSSRWNSFKTIPAQVLVPGWAVLKSTSVTYQAFLSLSLPIQ